jgi:fumarate reductase iron-sulfur subunit
MESKIKFMADSKYKIRLTLYNRDLKKFTSTDYIVKGKKDLTVLEALHIINRNHKISLSYRFSCEMGICGSCGATVNGSPSLTCSTFCKDLKNPIEISPLRNFPVIKDLVVDIDSAMNKMRSALPYTNLVVKKSNKELLQSPTDLKKILQASQCIKCMLCYSACPVYNTNRNFIGPAAGALAYKYQKDNRDQLKYKRQNDLNSKDGVWNCTFIGECSNVCPKNVDPAKALQKLKAAGMLHNLKTILKPNEK